MKFLSLFLLGFAASILFSNSLKGQDINQRPSIEVTAVAELEIIPDEIFLNIVLNEKDTKDKKTIADLERLLKQRVVKTGISIENLMVSDAGSDFVTYWYKKSDIMVSKTYLLKISSAEVLARLMPGLEEDGISNVSVSHVSHSKMEEFKKEVKIKAVKAAQEKATYLLAAIGQQVGKPLRIVEIQSYYPPVEANYLVKAKSMDSIEEELPPLSYRKITLKGEVQATFEIK